MKANAPEKIYLHPDLDSIFGMTERSCESEIEYCRTDAFIEKACDAYCKVCGHYLHSNLLTCRHNCVYYEDFRKYMKGE